MYENILVYDNDKGRWADYTVTSNANKFNGYVEDSKGRLFEFSKPTKSYEVDVYYPCGKRKPSIYKRSFPWCCKDEYVHVGTKVRTKVTKETHDFYHNFRNDRWIDKVNTTSYYGNPLYY